MKIEFELNRETYNKLLKNSASSEMSVDEYIKSILEKELVGTVRLEYDYVYDLKKRVLMKGDTVIILTDLEKQLIDLLIRNINKFVSSDEIIKNLSRSKEMSIFSMRNFIKKIRDKTSKDLITVKSAVGYMIRSV